VLLLFVGSMLLLLLLMLLLLPRTKKYSTDGDTTIKWIKLNNAEEDSNDTTTTQVEVEDKDGYYKQDKDDDKYEDVSMDILLYSILIQFFSQK